MKTKTFSNLRLLASILLFAILSVGSPKLGFTPSATKAAALQEQHQIFSKRTLPSDFIAKDKKLPLIGWSEGEPVDCKIDEVSSFPTETTKINVTFEASDIVSEGDSIKSIWFFDGEQVLTAKLDYDGGECMWFSLYMTKKGAVLEDGEYRIELYIGKTLIGEADTTIGGEGEDGGSKDNNKGSEDPIVWVSKADKDNCPIDIVDTYPEGVEIVNAVLPDAASVLEDGNSYNHSWYIDDENAAKGKIKYSGSQCYSYTLYMDTGEPLPNGQYRLEIAEKGDVIATAEVSVGGKEKKKDAEGVMLQGVLKDAETGKPIKKGVLVLLNPGVDPQEWIDNDVPKEDVYSNTSTDNKGKFRFEDMLESGETYPLLATAEGYQPNSGEIEVSNKPTEDVLDIEIELDKN